MIPIAVNTQTSSLCLQVLYQSPSSSLTLFLLSFSSFASALLDSLPPLLCITPLRKVMVPVECESIQPFVGIIVRMRHKIAGCQDLANFEDPVIAGIAIQFYTEANHSA